MKPVYIPKGLEESSVAPPEQMSRCRGLLGSGTWLGHNTRPDLCAAMSLGQQRLQQGATIKDIKAASHIARRARQFADFGITLRGLIELEETLKQLVADGFFKKVDPITFQPTDEPITAYEELTTGDVVHQWAKLASVTGTDRLADCAALIDPKDIGLPLYFM